MEADLNAHSILAKTIVPTPRLAAASLLWALLWLGGQAETTFVASDVFRVAVVGGQVSYSRNGVVFYTSAKPPLYPLLLDTSLQDLNVRIENAHISGAF